MSFQDQQLPKLPTHTSRPRLRQEVGPALGETPSLVTPTPAPFVLVNLTCISFTFIHLDGQDGNTRYSKYEYELHTSETSDRTSKFIKPKNTPCTWISPYQAIEKTGLTSLAPPCGSPSGGIRGIQIAPHVKKYSSQITLNIKSKPLPSFSA